MMSNEIVSEITDLSKKGFSSFNKVFFTNDLKTLARHLSEKLSSSKKSSSLRTLCIIPSHLIKEFLRQSLTSEQGFFFNIHFLSLGEAISHFLTISHKKSLNFPSYPALYLFLEREISLIYENKDPFFWQLLEYLENDPAKIPSLAKTLAKLFLSYAFHGNEEVLRWEKEEGFQQALFKKAKHIWDFPLHQKDLLPRINYEVLVFHPTYISPLEQKLLDFFSSFFDISYFYLSPTPHYWNDLLSKQSVAELDKRFREKSIPLEERIAFDALIENDPPLFASLGAIQKPLNAWLMEKDLIEDFTCPSEENALQKIKSDIFHMRPKSLLKQDTSIQVHETSNLMNEIQVLLHNIQKLAYNHQIKPEEILVLTPSIDLYFPHIQFVFDDPDCPFGYEVFGLALFEHSASLQMLSLFLSLVEKRFSKNDLLTLLFSPLFKAKQLFSQDDLETIELWINEGGITWGFDQKMRSSLLKEKNLSERGSWQFAFNTFLKEIAFPSSPIDLSKAELFGQFVHFIETLASDLEEFITSQQPLALWIQTLFTLLDNYFISHEDLSFLFRELKNIHSSIPEFPLSFASFKEVLTGIFHKRELPKVSFSNKPLIRFASLREGSIYPTKVLYLLGFDEESFPRHNSPLALKAVFQDASFEKTKSDRFLFLQSLIHAEQFFLISFACLSKQDQKKLKASLRVQELLDLFSNFQIERHPPFPFNKYYTSQDHFSFKNYTLAKAHYFPKFELPQIYTASPKETHLVISIAHLFALARHPIRFFANHALSIFLEREKKPEEKEFFLSYLDESIAVNDLLKGKKSSSLQDTLLPTALFFDTARTLIREEVLQRQKQMEKLELSLNDFCTLIFDPVCDQPHFFNEKTFVHPAIEIIASEGGIYTLQGKIDGVTKKGFYISGESRLSDLWKNLPYLALIERANTPFPPTYLFGKDGNVKQFYNHDNHTLLPLLIQYYESAKRAPSPLLPDRIELLMKTSYTHFIDSFQEKSYFEDPYLNLMKPDLSPLWEDFAKALCKNLIV